MSNVWIIGASQGIGLAVALQLQSEGWNVTVSARDHERLGILKLQHDLNVYGFDASDEGQVIDAMAELFEKSESVPELVLINIGDYEPMSIEHMPSELFTRLNQHNFLGPMYLLVHLLPRMRGLENASIWVNASLAAYRGLPKSAAYSAPKAAVLNMVESLHVEAKTWGIHLGVINHGFVRTRLTDKNKFHMPGIIEVDSAAARIINGIKLKKFEITFPLGFTWWMKFMRVLPYGIYFFLTQRMIGQ